MLYTFDFLGIDEEVTTSMLNPVPCECGCGTYGNIFEGKEVIRDLLCEAINLAEKDFESYCLGIQIFMDGSIEMIEKNADADGSFSIYGTTDFDAIREFFSDVDIPYVAILQEVDDNEWRVVNETIYELNTIIK